MPVKNPNGATVRTTSALASSYSQSLTVRHSARRLATAAAILSFGLANGGCSTSYQLGAMFGKDDGKPEYSGSIAAQPVSAKVAAGAAEGDLALARRAAVEVLARGTDASQAWENPRTGARGTVTPLASSYPQDGATCHDFLTSYVQGDQESWYQGGACRHGSGWQVRDLRPLRRT